jgi:predicted Zn-dependent peptidase
MVQFNRRRRAQRSVPRPRDCLRGARGRPRGQVRKYRLPNGLTVILSEDHRLPQVAVDIWYHVGAANQTPGHSGFGHLFEHMMFSGSKHVQPDFHSTLAALGIKR